MSRHPFMKIALVIFSLVPAAIQAQTSDRPDRMRFLPDVVGQFQALADRPETLGLNTGGSPDPSACKHYQSVVRVQGADGTSFLIVSRSGNLPEFGLSGVICNDSSNETGNGHLIVFRMGSRNNNGERMRSNRLQKGAHVNGTTPNADDKATIFFTVTEDGLLFQNGGNDEIPPPRGYQHPGGMQVVGNMLALAVEHPRPGGSPAACIDECVIPSSDECQRCLNYDQASTKTRVMFFDISNPEAPQLRSQYALVDGEEVPRQVAGTVAITPLPDGHYLMAVTGGEHNPSIWFYRSTLTDLSSTALSWLYVDGWHADTSRHVPAVSDCAEASVVIPGGFCLSPDEQYLEQDWPDGNDGHTHQTLQFLRQGNVDGTLYLAGARGKPLSDTSTIDLYRVDCVTTVCLSGDIKLKRIVTRDLSPFPNTGGTKLASFAAASSFYVSPSGELLFYATEHDNDGPNDSVKAGEWRHKNMFREGSPALLPSAQVNGPYEVDEGSSVSLTGTASPPIAKAWIQFFHDADFRSFSPVVDFDDYHLDDFDDFFALESVSVPIGSIHHNDEASSWRWFAPPGCSIQAIDREGQGPVDETVTLADTDSRPHADFDLRSVPNDDGVLNVDDEIDAVRFLQNCSDYYSTPFSLLWDLDLNGSFESTGSSVTFQALVDGPSQVTVPVQAQHPAGGLTSQTTAMITVKNVAPSVAGLALVDSLGRRVGVDVPFALVGLEYTVQGSFTDPGIQDHQTANLNLGDGTSVPSTGFDLFTDSFGGVTGQLRKRHLYANPGTFTINLEVVDDDGGQNTGGISVRVVSLAESLQWVLDEINSRLAMATSSSVRAALRDARDDLAGSNNGMFHNGALHKLADGNFVGALMKIKDATRALERAESAGSGNLVLLKVGLGLTSEGIAERAYVRALASVGTPNSGEIRQLERIRASIASGHARLAAGAYVAAVEEFKEAAARAACLEAFLCIDIEL